MELIDINPTLGDKICYTDQGTVELSAIPTDDNYEVTSQDDDVRDKSEQIPGTWCGIHVPTLQTRFMGRQRLEEGFQRYSLAQRSEGIRVVHGLDLQLKLLLLTCIDHQLVAEKAPLAIYVWTAMCMILNIMFILLTSSVRMLKRCLTRLVVITYLMLIVEGVICLYACGVVLDHGRWIGDLLMSWHVIFTLHVTCSLLPLSLFHCSIFTGVYLLSYISMLLLVFQWVNAAQTMPVLAIAVCGLYTRLLLDRSQRAAYLETRRAVAMAMRAHQENEKQEQLLLSILPQFVVGEMVRDLSHCEQPDTCAAGAVTETSPAQFHKIYVRRCDNVTIVFADIVGFTAMASSCTADELVKLLNIIFARFDHIAEATHCLRIKLLGDCYYAVSGLPDESGVVSSSQPGHAVCGVEMALGMLQAVRSVRQILKVDVDMRIGVHSGSVLCGVIGLRKWQFDVWSDDVTLANHLEASGVPGRVHISDVTLNCLGGVYDVQETNLTQRSDYIRKRDITTYLICRTSPLYHRMGQMLYQSDMPSASRLATVQLRRISNLSSGDEPVSEWMTELPFENVDISAGKRREAAGVKLPLITSNTVPNVATTTSPMLNSTLKQKPCTELSDRFCLSQPPAIVDTTGQVIEIDEEYSKDMSGRREDTYREDGNDLEQFITHSVETEAQLQYRRTSMKPISLMFRNDQHEVHFQLTKTDLFKSSMVGLVVLWGIEASYYLLISPSPFLCIVTVLTTFVICAAFLVVMGDEFTSEHCVFYQLSCSVKCQLSTGVNDIMKSDEPDVFDFYLNRQFVSIRNFIIGSAYLSNHHCANNSFRSKPLDSSFTTRLAYNTSKYNCDRTPVNSSTNQLSTQLSNDSLSHWLSLCDSRICAGQHNTTATCLQVLVSVSCVSVEATVQWWLVVVASVGVLLRLDSRVRSGLALLLVGVYSMAAGFFFSDQFHTTEIQQLGKYDSWLTLRVILLVSVLAQAVIYQSRTLELISRYAFLWKLQVKDELETLAESRENNTHLLSNILPEHVVNHFLSCDRIIDELYSRKYECVGVLFAGISNFSAFYSEDINKGLECLRLLNEIIADFDSLLDEWRFSYVEKIKTIGSTYMVTSGLKPLSEKQGSGVHLSSLIKFAFEMEKTLSEVNKHSFNDFKLRIGASCGPLVGGVIGAKKPVFDIWSDTVNEASRMESTGLPGHIQVTSPLAKILKEQGFIIESRGIIQVKGKGGMETFFVKPPRHSTIGKRRQQATISKLGSADSHFLSVLSPADGEDDEGSSLQRQGSTRKNLATVMYGVMQNQRRSTLRSVSKRRKPTRTFKQSRRFSSTTNQSSSMHHSSQSYSKTLSKKVPEARDSTVEIETLEDM